MRAVCGPSRMSYYTGQYGLLPWRDLDFVPLPIGEMHPR